jgi:hypothetical protein
VQSDALKLAIELLGIRSSRIGKKSLPAGREMTIQE